MSKSTRNEKAGLLSEMRLARFDSQLLRPVRHSSEQIPRKGACAHLVMREYYPQAVYCNNQLFIAEGWKGCFAYAKATRKLFTER